MHRTNYSRLAAAASPWIAAAVFGLSTLGISADNARWGAGYFPNVPLTTQDGVQVRFYDDLIKGRIVAVNLIYTTCKYACPLETARLSQVAKLLGDRMGRDVFFYSITIDPDHDTPDVLKEYAAKYQAGPGWTFLTGKQADIETISKKLGLYSEPDPLNPDGHTAMLVVGNEATGQWMRNSAIDTPKFLARTIGDWLNSWQTTRTRQPSYASVPALTFDRGEYTFRHHCAACHTIGKGDHLGPDLQGVTGTRDRDWLTRFIVAPDRVVAAGDPIAQSLLAKYKQVLMPNLGLGADDANVLIAYIEAQSRAAQDGASTPAVAASAPTAADLTHVVDPYLRIHRALSDDELTGVADAARAIAAAAAALGANGADIAAAAYALQAASDLSGAREAFARLSDAVIARVSDSAAPLADVKAAYCPMARRHWLQRGDVVQNPYYGRRMSDCGRVLADIPRSTR